MALDLAQFHEGFYEESFEALDTMESALLKLNVGAPDKELINTIFRVAHSIKGGSATFGFTEIASFTHTLETMLDELRSGKMQASRPVCDLLLKSVDVMREMLRAVQHKSPLDAQRVADLQFDLEMAIIQKPTDSVVASAPPAAAATNEAKHDAQDGAHGQHRWSIEFSPLPHLLAHGNDPLRMLRELSELGQLESVVDLEQLPPLTALYPESCYLAWQLTLTSEVTEEVIAHVFDWAEGDCVLKIAQQRASIPAPAATATAAPIVQTDATKSSTSAVVAHAPPASASSEPEAARPASGGDSSSIRVSIEKIDELMNTVGELVITQSMLSQLGSRVEGAMGGELRSGLVQLERNVRELQESVMRVRMLPISFVFSRFPRMVRDLSHRLNKQVELKVTGDQTELDKTVMEKIGDPLTHLVRNCVDHGIEMPDVRVAAGKPALGTVHLNAYHKGGSITIEVSDDGGGLNAERIIAKARGQNLIGANEVLTDEQAYALIFMAGFSTAEKTTDISGRGVGMDVVRRNVKELGGTIDVRSTLGKGSRFIINLPLTLAIVDGQSVSVGKETYIVPLTTIIESLQLKPSMVNSVVGHGEVFSFRDDYVPVIRLHDLFGVQPRTRVLHEGLLMIVEGDGRRVGLFVDDLLGQQQVVIKSLETNYRRVDGVSGATILGDGSVALILDVPGLIRVAAESMAA
jgi:two-component system, chemotaxis family, sensor kinase CheA